MMRRPMARSAGLADGEEPGVFLSKLAHRERDDDQTEPRDDSTHDLGIRGAEQPSQILSPEIAKDPDRFEAENPTGVEPDGQIKCSGALEGVAQHGADQKESQESREERL